MTIPQCHHDHSQCVATALHQAEQECRRVGVRLTDIRRRVLELVWQSHVPVGAYDILSILGKEGFCPAPPTVYRALDFLLDHHLVHRIARLNAFVGCTRPGQPHAGQFLLCRQCGQAAEITDPAIDQAMQAVASRLGFALSGQSIEADGLCADCQKDAAND